MTDPAADHPAASNAHAAAGTDSTDHPVASNAHAAAKRP